MMLITRYNHLPSHFIPRLSFRKIRISKSSNFKIIAFRFLQMKIKNAWGFWRISKWNLRIDHDMKVSAFIMVLVFSSIIHTSYVILLYAKKISHDFFLSSLASSSAIIILFLLCNFLRIDAKIYYVISILYASIYSFFMILALPYFGIQGDLLTFNGAFIYSTAVFIANAMVFFMCWLMSRKNR